MRFLVKVLFLVFVAAIGALANESHPFQAEMTRLMDIIINSLYSNREIFLRELISNSADALDKIRYLSLTDPSQLGEGDASKLEIRISYDKEAKVLSLQDSGIGMTKEQLIKNLGTVAKSGTSEFFQEAKKSEGAKDALSLIGQFGVGFYSVYLVADKVTVTSKNNDDDQYVWSSALSDESSSIPVSFSVEKDTSGFVLPRGTLIRLHLKEDAQPELLNEVQLESIVKKYSEFINFPIYLETQKEVQKEVEDEEAPEEVQEEEIEGAEAKPAKEKKTVTEVEREWKVINNAKAIWLRPSKEVTEEEYAKFYRQLTRDDEGEALAHSHFSAEGDVSFKSLVYIPKKAPAHLYDSMNNKQHSLKLYVRRVLISDSFDSSEVSSNTVSEDKQSSPLLPRYLSLFIRGVVDSDDLPLQVSRESLSQNKLVKMMGKKITRKVIDLISKIAEEDKKSSDDETPSEETASGESKYETFWKNFGKSIKLGVLDDKSNKKKLLSLLRFTSSKSEGKLIGLDDYVARFQKNQKHIYYITGENEEQVRNSPFLERLNKKDLEVLFLVDPLDEYLVQSVTEFEGHTLQSVTKEGLKIDGENSASREKRIKQLNEEFAPLSEWLQKLFGSRVEKVTISDRLTDSPCVLVTGQWGWTANMERIMRAQTFGNAETTQHMLAKKTLEINPYHPLVRTLLERVATPTTELEDAATLMYEAALVHSGFAVREPQDFSSRIYRVIAQGLDISPDFEIAPQPADEVIEESDATTETSSASSEAEL